MIAVAVGIAGIVVCGGLLGRCRRRRLLLGRRGVATGKTVAEEQQGSQGQEGKSSASGDVPRYSCPRRLRSFAWAVIYGTRTQSLIASMNFSFLAGVMTFSAMWTF